MSQGRKIGRFTDAELIGKGGFGSVYRADDVAHGRQVAVKVLQGTLGETERRRFDRERQTMGRLGSHPNIMPVHESGYTDEGEGYIVMELASGSLRDRLNAEGTLSWQEAVTTIVAIAGAAQAAHDQGVLHRDIKPDNILVDTYGNPRLTDFGIASVASNQTATTSTSATLAHAAPELLDGRPSTEAVDVYALGSTLYHLILGQPPFYRSGDSSVTAMITRTLTEPPPDLAPYGVPSAIASVMARAMAKNPAERQASAAQLAAELTAAQSGGAGITGGVPAGDPSATVAVPVTPLGSETIVASSPMIPTSPDATAVAGIPIQTGTGELGSRPVTEPLPAAVPPVDPGSGSGSNPPITPFEAASPSAPEKKSRGGLLIVGLVILAALIGGGVATAVALSGNDESPTNPNNGTAIATADTDPTDEDTTTTAADDDTTTTDEDTTTTEDSTTTSEDTTTTTEDTTTSSSTTTSTTSTTQPDGPCARTLVDATTDRFDLTICSTNDGNLTYIGFDRPRDIGIDLPNTCYDGAGSFFAFNNGFTYQINLNQNQLLVTDPDGAAIVDEPLNVPVATTPFNPADSC